MGTGELLELNGEADHVHADGTIPEPRPLELREQPQDRYLALLRKESADKLNRVLTLARILVSIVLHHLVRGCDTLDLKSNTLSANPESALTAR
jgi:hypothetical protein